MASEQVLELIKETREIAITMKILILITEVNYFYVMTDADTA